MTTLAGTADFRLSNTHPSVTSGLAKAEHASERVAALDGLRGIAISLVMLQHFTAGQQMAVWLSKLLYLGWVGIDLFFVLSGFLITGILLRAKTSQRYFRNFYMRRILRIFPLYYGALIAFLLIPPLFYPHPITSIASALHSQPWLWAYLTNLALAMHLGDVSSVNGIATAHFWSLAVEEHYYILWPLIVLLLNRRFLVIFSLFCMAGTVAARWAVIRAGLDPVACYFLTPCRLDGLLAGSILAIYFQNTSGREVMKRWGPISFAFLVLAGAVVFSRARQPSEVGKVSYIEITKHSLLACIFGALVACTVTSQRAGWLSRLLSLAPLRSLGKYSYAIYVLHVLSIPLVKAMLPASRIGLAGQVLAEGLCSFAMAWLSWHLFEKHFLKLKRFFEYRRPGKTASEAMALHAV